MASDLSRRESRPPRFLPDGPVLLRADWPTAHGAEELIAVAPTELINVLAKQQHEGGRDRHAAIALLKADGVVEEWQRLRVRFRAWQPLVYRPQSEFRGIPPTVDIYTTLLESEGRDGGQSIEVEGITSEESIRRRLQLAEDEFVAVRQRTSYVDGEEPFATDDSYVPLKLVEVSEWMIEGTIERGTNQVLAEL